MSAVVDDPSGTEEPSAAPRASNGEARATDLAGARVGLFARLGDRLNPILVKEVRQSLQGKYFRWMFLITLTTATVVACALILLADDVHDLSGPDFFVFMYGCLSAAVHVFIPFSVFTSLGAEWEENTYDLLVISGLKPRQIALGKLLSATTQLVLYFSAFGPFLVFAFLLKGLDLTAVGVILGGTLFTSTLLSALALGISSLSRQRAVRVLLLTLLAGGFVQATIGTTAAAFGIIRSATILHDPNTQLAMAGLVSSALLVGAFFFAIASSRLAHPEENRSSPLRVLALVAVGAGAGWMLYFMLRVVPLSPGDLQEALPTMLLVPLLPLAVASLFFVTEPERLGRRVQHTVPANPLLALCAAPFLPGGGRGFLLLLLELGLLTATGLWARMHLPGAEPFPNASDTAFLAGISYTIVYLGLTPALLAKREYHVPRLIVARLSVPVLLILGILLPTLIGFFLGIDGLEDFEHIGVPPWVLDELLDGDDLGHLPTALHAAAGIVVLFNLPRMLRGVREVLGASAARRARKAPAASRSTDAPSAA